MINKVILVGRLTRDPELRTATSGRPVSSFTLAVDGSGKNPDGSRVAVFVNCVAFAQTAENLAKYTKKGSLIGVDGSISQRKYQRKDGTNASAFEILCNSVKFLESAGRNEEIPPYDEISQTPTVEQEVTDSEPNGSIDLTDDDLPWN